MRTVYVLPTLGLILLLALSACIPAKTPTPTPVPTLTPVPSKDYFPISKSAFYWKGSLIQNPDNGLTLTVPDCSQPLDVSSFGVAITTSAAATFNYVWTVRVFPNNPGNPVYLFVSPQTSSTFNGPSTQMINQGIPFSLPCGAYTVELSVTSPYQQGFLPLLMKLIIQGPVTPTLFLILPGIFFYPNLNANCRSGPNMFFDPVSFAVKGQSYLIKGRISDGSWLYIQLTDQVLCWVPLADGSTSGDTGAAPEMTAVPTLTPPPAPFNCAAITDPRICAANTSCYWNSGAGSCQNK